MTSRQLVGAAALLTFILSATDAVAAPIGFSVRADTGDHLFAIDLATGKATDYGQIPFGAEGLAFVGGTLYAIDGYPTTTDQLWDVSPPGWVPVVWPTNDFGVPVGPTGQRMGYDADLSADPAGNLFNLQGYESYDDPHSYLYRVNRATGAATYVGTSNVYADGFAINAAGQGFAVDGKITDSLYRVDVATGSLARVGGLGLGDVMVHSGLAFDETGALWMITTAVSSAPSRIYRIDTATGAATLVNIVTIDIPGLGTYGLNGFQSLAIALPRGFGVSETGPGPAAVPEPGTLTLLALCTGWIFHRRRSRAQRRAGLIS